jgi:hypothetical protein
MILKGNRISFTIRYKIKCIKFDPIISYKDKVSLIEKKSKRLKKVKLLNLSKKKKLEEKNFNFKNEKKEHSFFHLKYD